MTQSHGDRVAGRLSTVEEHLYHENEHDLEGILSTFGEAELYEEESYGKRHEGARSRAGLL